MEVNNKYALIKNGIVVNVILWDWSGEEGEDIFKEYEKAFIDDSCIVGVGFIASRDSDNNWVFNEPDTK